MRYKKFYKKYIVAKKTLRLEWGAWQPVGSCSATCGNGTRQERRECQTGNNCVGQSFREQPCNEIECEGTCKRKNIGHCIAAPLKITGRKNKFHFTSFIKKRFTLFNTGTTGTCLMR